MTHSYKGISISQRKYCTDLPTDIRMLECKPISTPMDYNLRLKQDDGRLLYLTTTSLDITYLVQQLSQFMARPTQKHQSEAIRILIYLNKAPREGLIFPRKSQLLLSGFSGADWGTCNDTRRSISRNCLFLGNSLISWKTKKQSIVAKSIS